jgi:hypothetical protein
MDSLNPNSQVSFGRFLLLSSPLPPLPPLYVLRIFWVFGFDFLEPDEDMHIGKIHKYYYPDISFLIDTSHVPGPMETVPREAKNVLVPWLKVPTVRHRHGHGIG